NAKITIKEIEDVRGSKRDYIMERAKKLLAGITNAGMETKEMHQEIQDSAKTSKITEYGDERLPAGDLSDYEVIVVEGRADVVNLLRYGIKNVIGMNGTNLPAEIEKLGKEKELTLFVDGDRGGKLIATNVCNNAKIAFIAQAPDGKEVEELAGKDLHLAIRKRVTPEEFFKKFDRNERSERPDNRERNFSGFRNRDDRYSQPREYRNEREEAPKSKSEKTLSSEDKKKIREIASEIRGKNVLVLNESLDIVRNVPVSKLDFLRLEEPIWVLLTSLATGAVIEGAQKLGAKYVAAQSFGKIDNNDGVELVSI
ncbi:MAG: toprim domain-containing protein, partial [archaeon]